MNYRMYTLIFILSRARSKQMKTTQNEIHGPYPWLASLKLENDQKENWGFLGWKMMLCHKFAVKLSALSFGVILERHIGCLEWESRSTLDVDVGFYPSYLTCAGRWIYLMLLRLFFALKLFTPFSKLIYAYSMGLIFNYSITQGF